MLLQGALHKPKDKVFFTLSPSNNPYDYHLFFGVVTGLIENGDSFVYKVAPKKILGSNNRITELNGTVWSCVNKETGYRYQRHVKNLTGMEKKDFLKNFDEWFLLVYPTMVSDDLDGLLSIYEEVLTFSHDRIKQDLGKVKDLLSNLDKIKMAL